MYIYYNDDGAQVFSKEEMDSSEVERIFNHFERAMNRTKKDMERSLKKENV